MTISLVTSGASLTGAHVVNRFIYSGHEVVLDDQNGGFIENINPRQGSACNNEVAWKIFKLNSHTNLGTGLTRTASWLQINRIRKSTRLKVIETAEKLSPYLA